MTSEGKDLRALQKEWYQRLKDEGFRDIECKNQRFLKHWHSRHFFDHYSPEQIEERLSYYRQIDHFLYHYEAFQSDQEQEIWRLHAEGYSRRKIALHLQLQGVKISDSSIQIILTRLTEIMHTQNWPSSERGYERSDDSEI